MKFFLSGMLAALVGLASPAASAYTVGYASWFLGGGFDLVRLDLDGYVSTIGSNDMLPSAGAFAGDDYSTQYIVDFNIGRLEAIDVHTGHVTLIGIADLGDNVPIGLGWDPTSRQMYLLAADDPCTTSTLYVIDLASAATFELGSTPRCISGLAIGADGAGYGVDLDEDALVSIDIGTGASSMIGPTGFRTSSLVLGLAFDPSTGLLNLFAFDEDAQTIGRYLVSTDDGAATLVRNYNFAPLGIALAVEADAIFTNGFDPE